MGFATSFKQGKLQYYDCDSDLRKIKAVRNRNGSNTSATHTCA